MNFPVQLHIGPLSFSLHAAAEAVGIFIGFRLFLYLRRRRGDTIEQVNRLWVIVGAIFGALFGSRIIGALENPVEWLHSSHPIMYFYQNKTIVGGFLGGLIGVELVKKFISESRSSGDLFVYPMILALIIGRIGCFSMGIYEETYGIATNSALGMNLGDGLNRYPVALFEIAFLLTFWLILYTIQQKVRLDNGALFKLFMIGYLLFRFLLDFIKPHYSWIAGLSTIQLTCLAGLIYYHQYLINPRKLTAAYARKTVHLL